ncbi:MAG: FKBP-type peptidyl-prolyl cis-trans isomerase [Myxococcales bacterium]|jgi:FKBP-type peptidyl-prolyl cis-trans isomerase FkpA|nr:FKBP-type peptidyl-prolyl cis-trans isomerase [Myxococcales bacterium]
MFQKILMGCGLAAMCVGCQPASSTADKAQSEKAPSQAAAASVVGLPDSASDDEKALYYLGYSMGSQAGTFDLADAEKDVLKKGFMDALVPGSGALEMREVGPKIQGFVKRRQETMAEKNKQKGDEYMAQRAAEAGVEKSSTGLLFKSIQEGEGAQPADTDVVKVHYTGTLIDGTKFDSSYDRKGPDGTAAPATFPLKGVIPCWTEGVQKMKVGGKAQLICPSELAYGPRPRPKIPGGSTLIFDVELVEILPQQEATVPNGPRPAPPFGPGGIPQNPPGQPQWRK